MDLKEVKKKFGSVLESALIGINKLPGGNIFKVDDTHLLFTGQEAEDRQIGLTPIGEIPVDRDMKSAFSVNEDGSFKYPSRKPKFKKHDSYEMMENTMKRIGSYKRRR